MIFDNNDLSELLNAYKNKKNYKESKWIKLSTIPIYERLDPQYHCKQIEFKDAEYVPLKDFLLNKKFLNGVPYKSKYFGHGNVPLVKIRHLNNSLLNINNLETIPRDYYITCNNISLNEGDILLAMDGNKEFRASYVDKEILDVAVNQRIAVIRIDKQKISSTYIFFVLISGLGQKQLMKSKTQTATVAHLSNSLIESVKIPLINKKQINKIDENFKNYIVALRSTQNIFDNLTNSL